MAQKPEDADLRSAMLLRDAEEDLQRERLHAFWAAWGSTIIGMALMLVLGTGAGVAWREWRESRNAASTMLLMDVLEQQDAAAVLPGATQDMQDNHAAMAWLIQAGSVEADAPERRIAMQENYARAAAAGDDTAWGFLARLNLLRLRMDSADEDADALLKEYEDLANDMGDSALSSLAWTDAAVIAGERLNDPKRALGYLDHADEHITGVNAMAITIADLKHLYAIRAQSMTASETTQNGKDAQ